MRAAQDQTRAAQDQTRATESEGDLKEQNESEREPFEPATPRNPVPREGVGGSPPLTAQVSSPLDGSRSDSSALTPSPQDTFTQDELDLLGSRGIVRSPQGEWFHSERYPDGRTMITPVNSHAELRRLSDVRANGTVTSRTADTPNLRAPVGT